MIKRDTDVEVVSKATTNQRIGRSNVQEINEKVTKHSKENTAKTHINESRMENNNQNYNDKLSNFIIYKQMLY